MVFLSMRLCLVVLLTVALAPPGGAAAPTSPALLMAGVPNLRGLSPVEVVERIAPLEKEGTHYEVQWVLFRTSHPLYEKLHRRVIAQSAYRPRGGKGYVLTLTLALYQGAAEGEGALPVGAMPKLVGLSREGAEKLLQELGGRGASFEVRWEGEGGTVQRQSFPAGSVLMPGARTLTLSLSIAERPGRPHSAERVRPPEPAPPAKRPERPAPPAPPALAMPSLGGLLPTQAEVVLRGGAEKGVRFRPTWRQQVLTHPSFEAFDGKVYFQSVRPGTPLARGEVPLVLHVARYVGAASKGRPAPAPEGPLSLQAVETTPPGKGPGAPGAPAPPPAATGKPPAAPPATTMPDLLNLERGEAEKRLAELHARGARFLVEWDDYPVKAPAYKRFDGKVFYQSIPPGTPLAGETPASSAGPKLLLHVLRYRPPAVPSFVGMDRLGVIREMVSMRREGVRVSPRWEESPVARSAEGGKVISQEPKAGEPLPQGDWEVALRLGRWTPELAGSPGSPRVAPAPPSAEGKPAARAALEPTPGAPEEKPKYPLPAPAAPPGKPGAFAGIVPVLPDFVGMTSQEAYRSAQELFKKGAPIEVRWEATSTADKGKLGRVLGQSVPPGQGLSEPTRVVLKVANRYEAPPPEAAPSTPGAPPAGAPAPPEKKAATPSGNAMPNLVGLAPRDAKRILAEWREKGVEFTVRWSIQAVPEPEKDLKVVDQSIAPGAAIPSSAPQVLLTVGRYRPEVRGRE